MKIFLNNQPDIITIVIEYVEYSRQQLLWTGLVILSLLTPLGVALFIIFCCSSDSLLTRLSDQNSSSPTGSARPQFRGAFTRTVSPSSELSQGRTSPQQKLPRKYDAVYLTHEPLPGKPNIDFPDDEILGDEDIDKALSNLPPEPPMHEPDDHESKHSDTDLSSSRIIISKKESYV